MGFFVMVFIIVAICCFVKSQESKQYTELEHEEYATSEYVVNALRFVEFYEKLPQKSLFVVTPELIGVVIPDGHFGVSVKTYLSLSESDSRQADTYRELFFKGEKNHLGGEAGVEQFKRLGLQVKLHNNDEDWPVVYMDAFCYLERDREHYVKAIESQYQKMYNKSLKIYHFRNGY